MSFILSPALAVAPAPTANPSAPVAARQDDAGQNKPGSFGEALARSLAPATEKTEKTAAPTTTVPARRQAGKAPATPEEVTDALVTSLMLPDGKTALAAPAGAAGSTGDALAAAGSALPGKATLPTDRASASAVPTDGAAQALDASADTGLEVALQPVLAAAGKGAGQAPAGPSSAAGPAIAVDRTGSASPSGAAHAGTGGQDPSPKRDGGQAAAAAQAAPPTAAKAEPVAVRSTAKTPASSATPALDAMAASTAPGQASAAPALTTGAALPLNAVNPLNTPPAPSGLAAPNAPAPVATATLAPEVGSSEWNQALGQQVIHMGKAGQ
jgi:flagellar hook-length control protein FliK